MLVGHLVPNCPALLGLLQASIGLQLSNKAGVEIMAVVVKENASKGVHSAEGIKTALYQTSLIMSDCRPNQ